MTVKVRLAIVSVPERADTPLALTLYVMIVLPLPLSPDVIPMKPELLEATHAQPVVAVRATDALPPLAGALALPGEIE